MHQTTAVSVGNEPIVETSSTSLVDGKSILSISSCHIFLFIVEKGTSKSVRNLYLKKLLKREINCKCLWFL